jgi:hypothetical protein
MIIRPSRRELIRYGMGAAAFAKMARGQVRIPGPGGGANSGGGGGGGWSLIAHTGAGTGVNATTSAINTTGANLIVIGVSANTVPATFSDSKGNTWTVAGGYQNNSINGNYSVLYYCYNPAAGSGHIFSTTSGGYPSIFVEAWSGAAASPLDQTNGTQGNTSYTTFQPGSITPTRNDELIVTMTSIAVTNGNAASSINDGFTISDSLAFSSGNYWGGAMAYLVQTTAAAVDPAWTYNGSVFAVANIASFK